VSIGVWRNGFGLIKDWGGVLRCSCVWGDLLGFGEINAYWRGGSLRYNAVGEGLLY
jgi:hypothetical protein